MASRPPFAAPPTDIEHTRLSKPGGIKSSRVDLFLAATVIAGQQKRLADSRFRNELFERSMRVFAAVARFIDTSWANAPVSLEKIREFDKAVLEAPFLTFHQIVLPYIREFRDIVLRLNQLHQTTNGTALERRPDEHFQHARMEDERLRNWLR